MKFWVTGAAGFLGGRVARRLTAAGHGVIGLSRREAPTASRSVRIDLADAGAADVLRDLLADEAPDAVIHAAALTPGRGPWVRYIAPNVSATAVLLDALREGGAPHVVFTSTLSVYGDPEAQPVTEDAATRPQTAYAASKLAAEQLFHPYREAGGSATILRLPSLYGAGQEDSFVDGLARLAREGERIELFGRGDVVRDAVHVEDVVDAVVAAVERPPPEGWRILNIGGGRRVTAREYADGLVALLGSGSEVVPVDRPATGPDLVADIGRAREALGYAPRDLEASLRRYLEEAGATPAERS